MFCQIVGAPLAHTYTMTIATGGELKLLLAGVVFHLKAGGTQVEVQQALPDIASGDGYTTAHIATLGGILAADLHPAHIVP